MQFLMKTPSRGLAAQFGFALRLVAIASVVLISDSFAADPFYVGTWKISSAVVAPWWDNANTKPDDAEMKSLVGKTIVIQPKRTSGPQLFNCNAPNYRVRNFPADSLFQGSFGEMRDRNKSVDPEKVAASLGFKGKSWKTLETGCANEIDYHFLDDVNATFGLNNYVFFLKKQ